MPIDGNLFRSLGVVGHIDGVKAIRVDSTRHFLFTIGHKCQSIFMWNINFEWVHYAKHLSHMCDYMNLNLFPFFVDLFLSTWMKAAMV